ncbi:MAG: rubrerythrin family protein [Thermoplasmatota archaeon]
MTEKKMTARFLEDAFSGESQAHLKYQLFADIAAKQGMPNIARMFRSIAYAELVHARNHYKALGEMGDTEDNLATAVDGETFEIEEMYPVYKQTAGMQGDEQAERAMHYALEAEKIHAELYKAAREAAMEGNDIDLDTVYICPVCGHTVVGNAPDCCPICGVKGERFTAFEA